MWRPRTNQEPERITPPRQGKIVVNLSSERGPSVPLDLGAASGKAGAFAIPALDLHDRQNKRLAFAVLPRGLIDRDAADIAAPKR